jgi:hypothetical protein
MSSRTLRKHILILIKRKENLEKKIKEKVKKIKITSFYIYLRS